MKNQRSIIEKTQSASVYARKHSVVYLVPLLFLLTSFYFLTQAEVMTKGMGLLLSLAAILRIMQVSMVKWYLTPDHVIVREGWPWAKRFQEIPVFELYQSIAAPGKFSRVFKTATLTARCREGSKIISHINISNADEFCQHVSAAVQKTPAQPLNSALALKEQGRLSEKEYEMIKLGVLTQKYLGDL